MLTVSPLNFEFLHFPAKKLEFLDFFNSCIKKNPYKLISGSKVSVKYIDNPNDPKQSMYRQVFLNAIGLISMMLMTYILNRLKNVQVHQYFQMQKCYWKRMILQ